MSIDFAGLSIEAARRRLATALREAAIDTPELDARLLVGHATALDLTGLAVAARRPLTVQETERLGAAARRRLAGEPVARILGEKEFWGLPLRLTPATLVPRPDTETAVEAALEAMANRPPRRIADLGTGSGALILALASEWPQAQCVATDLDEEALHTAAANARRLGFDQRVVFVKCNYAAALAGPFDLVVSNPPYIPSAEIAVLAPEVREHDPRRALDGGADGLDAYRTLIPQSAALLSPGGALIVEVGMTQDGPVAGMMAAAGLAVGPPRPDLGGIPRAVIGRNGGPQGPGIE